MQESTSLKYEPALERPRAATRGAALGTRPDPPASASQILTTGARGGGQVGETRAPLDDRN